MTIDLLLQLSFTSVGAGFGYKFACALQNKEPKPDENKQALYCGIITWLIGLVFHYLNL